MTLFILYMGVLLFSAIAGAVYWRWLKSRMLHYFVPLLFFTFLLEFYCYYAVNLWNVPTGWIYNIFVPVEVIFFAFFYYALPITKKFRTTILCLTILYFLAEVIVFGTIQPIHSLNSYLFLSGGLLVVICGILFLYQYFQLDNTTTERRWLPVVWITAGLIIFFAVSSITIALYDSLVSYQVNIFGMKLHHIIPRVLSIILYSCFARAFYLCKE